MQKQKWILLVEDNAHDADLAVRALRRNPSSDEVVVVRNGADALDCLYGRNHYAARHSGNPVVVVLDLKMPKVDGVEVLGKIKKDARLKSIPVVIFTSSCEETDLARCYQLGANAYVVKPVNFRKFSAALQEVGTFWTVFNEPPPDRQRDSDRMQLQMAFDKTTFKGAPTTSAREKRDPHLAA